MPEQGHNADRVRLSQSMDELMIKTIGLMETLPDRIANLENILRELEVNFSKHEGQQDQGTKRMVDRVANIEKTVEAKDIEVVKKQIQELKTAVKPLLDVLTSRKETNKTLRQYAKEALLAFIRYAMLPITILILVLLGMNPDYIPWYKTPSVKEESKDGASTKTEDKKHDNKNRPND